MTRGERRVLAICLTIAVLVSIGGPVTIAQAENGTHSPSQTLEPVYQQNNTTIHHRNPQNTSRPGDLAMVQSWLSGQMGSVLVDCTDGLVVGSYTVCDRLDDEYPEWLSKYVDVADETDTSTDDEASSEFEAASNSLGTYADQVSSFRSTYSAYQEARGSGGETEARRLARTLVDIAEESDETARRVNSTFTRLTNTTDLELRDESMAIRAVQANITAVATEVSRAEFRDTTLTATVETRVFSFTDPLVVSGRLMTGDGPLEDRRIRLRIGNQTTTARTDETGRYTLTFRPTTLRLSADTATIQFEPDPDSPYRRSRARREVSVTQVEPSLRVTVDPDSAAYNDQLSIDGRLSVEERAVPGVPILVMADGQRLATGETGAQGELELTRSVPASIPAGQVTVTAFLPFDNRAIAGVNDSTDIEIRSTPTSMSMSARQSGADQIEIQGRLETVSGTGVGAQPVSIRIEDQPVRSVDTSESGDFETTVTVPESVMGDGGANLTLAITGVYTGTGSNLEGSQASTTVQFSPPTGQPDEAGDGGDGGIGAIPDSARDALSVLTMGQWLVAGLGAIGILLLGFLFRRINAEPDSSTESLSSKEMVSEEPTATVDSTGEGPESRQRTPLEVAGNQLESGQTNEAVVTAYGAVRQTIQTGEKLSKSDTHWEFLAACRENGLDDRKLDAFTTLTEQYERAAFAPEKMDRVDADEAIELATDLV